MALLVSLYQAGILHVFSAVLLCIGDSLHVSRIRFTTVGIAST